MDARTLGLIGGVLVVLGTATAVIRYLRSGTDRGIDPAIVETFRVRVQAWWLLFAGLAGAFLVGQTAMIILFFLISFWALREFITLTPTRPSDHRTLFWVFFLCTPLQFILIAIDSKWLESVAGVTSYEVFSIMIPVYAFLLIPARIALSGDSKRFLERTAKIQAGLLICVYCLSYAPALLTLNLLDSPPRQAVAEADEEPVENLAPVIEAPPILEKAIAEVPRTGEGNKSRKIRLLFFFVLMVQLSDALQFACSRLPSRHVIVPSINSTRTWEGLAGGTASVTLLGAVLSFATPFAHWWQAALISAIVSIMGFAGGITMSAIKRDRGVRDYGTLVEGHGGVLDRIDSICFAAPVFYHVTCLFLLNSAG